MRRVLSAAIIAGLAVVPVFPAAGQSQPNADEQVATLSDVILEVRNQLVAAQEKAAAAAKARGNKNNTPIFTGGDVQIELAFVVTRDKGKAITFDLGLLGGNLGRGASTQLVQRIRVTLKMPESLTVMNDQSALDR